MVYGVSARWKAAKGAGFSWWLAVGFVAVMSVMAFWVGMLPPMLSPELSHNIPLVVVGAALAGLAAFMVLAALMGGSRVDTARV